MHENFEACVRNKQKTRHLKLTVHLLTSLKSLQHFANSAIIILVIAADAFNASIIGKHASALDTFEKYDTMCDELCMRHNYV